MKQLTDEQRIRSMKQEAENGLVIGDEIGMRDALEQILREADEHLGITGEAQPAREWVGLTDEKAAIEAAKSQALIGVKLNEHGAIAVCHAFVKLREKNAGQPAADDKAQPLLVRDLEAIIGKNTGEICDAMVELGFTPRRSANMALHPDEAIAVAKHFAADDKAGVEPVAWKHSCNALCVDGLELWIDRCPHCGKPRPQPQAEAVYPDKANNFYLAVCNFLVWIGREGTVHADDPIIDQLSNALHDIDGGVFKDSLKWPQDDLPAILKKQAS